MNTFEVLSTKGNKINGLKHIKPKVYGDKRGYFSEVFKEIEGYKFIQDNESLSSAVGVFRGMHLQRGEFAQAKLIRVIKGKVLDIVVDLRKEESTFGSVATVILSDSEKGSLLIPRGFAHGFLVLEPDTIVNYKVDNVYNLESEVTISCYDKDLMINNVIRGLFSGELLLSDKDKKGITFKEYKEVFVNE